jgi:peptidase M50B-like protein
MGRLYQLILIASMICLSWLGMQIVHELGHVLLAWACGETVHRVVLHPLVLSRTDASQNRHPILVAWGGPALGAFLPLVAFGISRRVRPRHSYMFQFFAGFCLVANGAYLGVGAFERVGDAGDLIRFGAPRWMLIIFGLVCVPLGLFLWNGLGRHFGLGVQRGAVDRRTALCVFGLTLTIILIEILVDSR